MTAGPVSAIRALPADTLTDLGQALRGGRLSDAATSFTIRYVTPGVDEAAATELVSLLASGLAPEHAALFLDAVAAERESSSSALELVTSGPDAAGISRDTGVALRELFAAAEHRVLVVGFAVHQGREVFSVLARRMQERLDLSVRLCLDVRRATGDTARPDALLRRFADRFLKQEWPGPRLPELFYDPRSLADGEKSRASLHARCVVVDGAKAFVGSANFTEAAQLRNIEIGVVVHRSEIAAAVERHVEALIQRGHLRPLALAR
jgi:phosphatidylserine/phosphatidylglycerophosphate/cardiolipin synthase-like enzyme